MSNGHRAVGACLLLLCLSSLPRASAQEKTEDPVPAVTITLEAYARQLRAWAEQVEHLGQPGEVLRFIAAAPERYAVMEGERRFEVSNTWLREKMLDLVTEEGEKRAQAVEHIQQKLYALAGEADAYAVKEASPGRSVLAGILARREFSRVKGPPGWWEIVGRVLERAFTFIGRVLRRVPYVEQSGQVFVWFLIAVVACVLAIYLTRQAMRPPIEVTREPVPFAPSARPWPQWLAEARAAAQDGQWREAIHLAYWSAIAYLETSGSWAPDRARTPREYLRLLAAGSPRRQPLAELTRKFELVWYGERPAGAADFEEALAHLGRMGCR